MSVRTLILTVITPLALLLVSPDLAAARGGKRFSLKSTKLYQNSARWMQKLGKNTRALVKAPIYKAKQLSLKGYTRFLKLRGAQEIHHDKVAWEGRDAAKQLLQEAVRTKRPVFTMFHEDVPMVAFPKDAQPVKGSWLPSSIKVQKRYHRHYSIFGNKMSRAKELRTMGLKDPRRGRARRIFSDKAASDPKKFEAELGRHAKKLGGHTVGLRFALEALKTEKDVHTAATHYLSGRASLTDRQAINVITEVLLNSQVPRQARKHWWGVLNTYHWYQQTH